MSGRVRLPTFEFLSVRDAHLELTLRGTRGAVLSEYMGYIEQLDPEHAGRLTAEGGRVDRRDPPSSGSGSAAAGEEAGGDQGRPGGLFLGRSGGPSASPRQTAQQ